MAVEYLDKTGLSYFFGKLKALFATKDVATQSANGLMSSTDKAKLDGLGRLSKLESHYTTTAAVSTVPIGISNFSNTDILLVDLNGLNLVEGTEYTVSGTNIVLANTIAAGNLFHFTVIRMVTT